MRGIAIAHSIMSIPKNTINESTAFSVGDHVYLLHKTSDGFSIDYQNKYLITSLRNEEGGSYHDGFTNTIYATLVDTETNRTQKDVLLRYESDMMRFRYDYAIH